MKWKKEKPIEGGPSGCLHCGYTHESLKMNSRLLAGFGAAFIMKNTETVYNESPNIKWEDAPTLMKFENMARKDPDNDWRFHLVLPLREATYQRQGKNHWVLIEKGLGFA